MCVRNYYNNLEKEKVSNSERMILKLLYFKYSNIELNIQTQVCSSVVSISLFE